MGSGGGCVGGLTGGWSVWSMRGAGSVARARAHSDWADAVFSGDCIE